MCIVEVLPDRLKVALQCRGHMAPHTGLGHTTWWRPGVDRGTWDLVCGPSSLFEAWLKGKPWAPGGVTVPPMKLAPRRGGREFWDVTASQQQLSTWCREGPACWGACARPSPGEWPTSTSPRSPRGPGTPVEPRGPQAPARRRWHRGPQSPRPPRVARGFLVRRRLTRAPRALVTRVTPCPALPSGPPSVFVLGFLCLYF